MITEGKHLLSGVGKISYFDEYVKEDIEVNLFCIDGITYGAFIDPTDGYRSYGIITKYPKAECQYTFPPQEVIIENRPIKNTEGYAFSDKELIIIKDAANNKEILAVGTDYYEDYYPMAIFRYTPENLEINKESSFKITLNNKPIKLNFSL